MTKIYHFTSLQEDQVRKHVYNSLKNVKHYPFQALYTADYITCFVYFMLTAKIQ